jgi:hypothetical protein
MVARDVPRIPNRYRHSVCKPSCERSALVGLNFTWVPLSYSQSRPAGDGEIKSSVVFGGRALEVHAVRRNCSA